jgi:hypothetical protein
MYGDRFAGHANKHVRFGVDAQPGKPKPGADHP